MPEATPTPRRHPANRHFQADSARDSVMKWFTAALFVAASIWAALGSTGVGIGLWGCLFVFSVMLPQVWRTHRLLVPLGYLLALISLWTLDQWVFVAMSITMSVLSLAGL